MNPEPIHIRQVEDHDAPLVTQFVVALLTELRGEPVEEEAVKTYTMVCQHLLAEKETYLAFLAESADGKKLGMITLGESVAIYAGGRFGIIHEFSVIAEARSSGVGRQLLGAACQYGKACGWHRLEVDAPDGNVWARTVAFYRRQGFGEIGPRLKRIL